MNSTDNNPYRPPNAKTESESDIHVGQLVREFFFDRVFTAT